MPCIFLTNMPDFIRVPHPDVPFYDPKQVVELKNAIATAAQCRPSGVEIHFSTEKLYFLQDSGYVASCTNIHGTVSWFGKEERGASTKRAIAKALHCFLKMVNMDKDFDLTFMDMPAESFYMEAYGEMIMVPGGEPLPPYQVITNAVSEITGYGQDE